MHNTRLAYSELLLYCFIACLKNCINNKRKSVLIFNGGDGLGLGVVQSGLGVD